MIRKWYDDIAEKFFLSKNFWTDNYGVDFLNIDWTSNGLFEDFFFDFVLWVDEEEEEAEEGKPEEGKPEEGKPEEGKPEEGKPEEGKPEEEVYDFKFYAQMNLRNLFLLSPPFIEEKKLNPCNDIAVFVLKKQQTTWYMRYGSRWAHLLQPGAQKRFNVSYFGGANYNLYCYNNDSPMYSSKWARKVLKRRRKRKRRRLPLTRMQNNFDLYVGRGYIGKNNLSTNNYFFCNSQTLTGSRNIFLPYLHTHLLSNFLLGVRTDPGILAVWEQPLQLPLTSLSASSSSFILRQLKTFLVFSAMGHFPHTVSLLFQSPALNKTLQLFRKQDACGWHLQIKRLFFAYRLTRSLGDMVLKVGATESLFCLPYTTKSYMLLTIKRRRFRRPPRRVIRRLIRYLLRYFRRSRPLFYPRIKLYFFKIPVLRHVITSSRVLVCRQKPGKIIKTRLRLPLFVASKKRPLFQWHCVYSEAILKSAVQLFLTNSERLNTSSQKWYKGRSKKHRLVVSRTFSHLFGYNAKTFSYLLPVFNRKVVLISEQSKLRVQAHISINLVNNLSSSKIIALMRNLFFERYVSNDLIKYNTLLGQNKARYTSTLMGLQQTTPIVFRKLSDGFTSYSLLLNHNELQAGIPGAPNIGLSSLMLLPVSGQTTAAYEQCNERSFLDKSAFVWALRGLSPKHSTFFLFLSRSNALHVRRSALPSISLLNPYVKATDPLRDKKKGHVVFDDSIFDNFSDILLSYSYTQKQYTFKEKVRGGIFGASSESFNVLGFYELSEAKSNFFFNQLDGLTFNLGVGSSLNLIEFSETFWTTNELSFFVVSSPKRLMHSSSLNKSLLQRRSSWRTNFDKLLFHFFFTYEY